MIAYAHSKRLSPGEAMPGGDTPLILFIPATSLEADAQTLGLSSVLIPPVDESASNRFESHAGYDCILLNIPDKTEDIQAAPINIDIYIKPNRLLFVHDPSPAIDYVMEHLDGGDLPFEQVLFAFFNQLTSKDTLYLESLEESIAKLEDDIAEEANEDCLDQISTLRKILLKQKRYFESLQDTMEDLEENQNGFFTPEQLRAIGIIGNRANRQFHSVLNLRDYVTQVRESYQAQMDISLNKIMKLFTVLTAIFSPLTLIVGWYGMNLVMPELGHPMTYPAVIIISIVIVGGMIAYFKKNKWF